MANVDMHKDVIFTIAFVLLMILLATSGLATPVFTDSNVSNDLYTAPDDLIYAPEDSALFELQSDVE